MTHINREELNELRAQLDAELASLEEELASHGRAVPESGDWQGTTGGLVGEEADPNDAADQMEELATNVPLVEELEKRYKDVAKALQNMEKGTYGVCEECEEPIPLKRLQANPAAHTCVTHSK
ncbi:MAG: TraR/DksA C4-type zinc finger protein [bacterium]|nr:TraR/DksA C4-type zinc finger protein [bacterium]